jgi:CheY-like chemotaxis protein
MGKYIIVVDDEDNTLELTKAVLEMNGFKVDTFDMAQPALDALNKNIPDLVLLDMRMPQIAGPDFCKKVKENPKLKNLKIVFFTASSFMDDKVLKESGALGYIFKPFDNEDLVKQVNKYLGV